MGTIYRRAAALPWVPHPEAEGLEMKELLALPGEGATSRVHRIPLAGIPEHAHPRRHLIWVLSGRGRLWVQDVGELVLEPGVFVYVPSDLPHRFHSVEEGLELLTVSLASERTR